MSQIKSPADFDLYLAIQKASGQFIRLNYGLASSQSLSIEKEAPHCPEGEEEIQECSSQERWQSSDFTRVRTYITIGTFLTSD